MGPADARVRGYHHAVVAGVPPGSLYCSRLNGQYERPDPASRLQPHDVHGPSQVVALTFAWDDGAWHGLPWSHFVLYELHVGTYTPAGTLKDHMDVLVSDHAQVFLVRRWCPAQESILLLHFGPTPRRVTLSWPPGV